MLNTIKKSLFITLFISLNFSLNAAHIIGGEMTYRCLGNDDYEITMTLYRDCNGVGADFDGVAGSIIDATVTIFRGTQIIGVENLVSPSISLIGLDNECQNLDYLCVEKGVYIFTVNLPPIAESYHISYQRCCRNNTLINIIEPESTGATFTVEINQDAQNTCNSSPVFNELPPIFIPINDTLKLDLSATDLDNDELRYSFCAPYDGGGTLGTNPTDPPNSATMINGLAPDPDAPPPYDNVLYLLPTYSAIEPIPGLTIDTLTGEVMGLTNTIIGQFLIGVCIEEYRNGVLLSTTRREIQLNVGDCFLTPVKEIDTKNDQLSIYPNPSSDYLYLDTSTGELPIRVEIFNLNGSLIAEQNVLDFTNKISIADLPNGAYFIRVIYDSGDTQFAEFVKY